MKLGSWIALAIVTSMAGQQAAGQVADSRPEDVVQAWAGAFNECSAAKLAALYEPAALLWGTNSNTLTSTPEGVRAYFDRACSVQPPIRVALREVVARVQGPAAVVSGSYDFSREGATFPARYSFALVSSGGSWRILQHHSALMPARP